MNCKTYILITLFFSILLSCGSNKNNTYASFDPANENLQIVLIHANSRCASCKAIEKESSEVLNNYFADELKTGAISFISISIDDKEGRKAAAYFKVPGQSLLLVNGDTLVDFTSMGFMQAHPHPDRFRKAFRDEIEKMLK